MVMKVHVIKLKTIQDYINENKDSSAHLNKHGEYDKICAENQQYKIDKYYLKWNIK